jgi:heme oxygenase
MKLDRMMLRFDLGRAEDYGLFLLVHHAALRDLEDDWRAQDRDDFSAMLRCLEDDLRVLGRTVSVASAPEIPRMSGDARLGSAYVIRGSRLGAAILRQRVPAGMTASYLDFRPVLTWPQFLQELDRASAASVPEANADVIRGAQATFNIFSTRLTQILGAVA